MGFDVAFEVFLSRTVDVTHPDQNLVLKSQLGLAQFLDANRISGIDLEEGNFIAVVREVAFNRAKSVAKISYHAGEGSYGGLTVVYLIEKEVEISTGSLVEVIKVEVSETDVIFL
ncbi:MAG: hypothetical protein ACRYF2_21160 [Janthinobacterium lividum]